MPERECIVCGRRGPFPPLFARDGFTLVRCPSCTLVFQDPQPDAGVLGRAYYHDEGFAQALLGDLRATTLERAREKLAPLRAAGALTGGARLLDVGASSGAWLEVAGEAGLRGTGVELGQATAAGARARGLDVRTGTLEEVLPQLGEERFDLITFWDVLEHLPDPRHEVRLAHGLLAPGGRVAMTFPNVDGLYPRLTRRLFARRTGVWEYPELPVHLYDFSPRTAKALLGALGFAVQAASTFATPYSFYEATSLSPARTGHGRKARALRLAFDVVHRAAYPVAARTDRGNAQFLLAGRA
jgi:2-polyprenyl-3-methyl-5-hydroxy-6-metoxy-1,4-benzoquinol methylase